MGSHMKDITASPEKVHPVAAARKRMNLSREGLAFKAHVSMKTIERIETGRPTQPHRATQNAIADVLGCAVSDLWREEEEAA
jgi:DNA-binding XRE family transcriptional regulator